MSTTETTAIKLPDGWMKILDMRVKIGSRLHAILVAEESRQQNEPVVGVFWVRPNTVSK